MYDKLVGTRLEGHVALITGALKTPSVSIFMRDTYVIVLFTEKHHSEYYLTDLESLYCKGLCLQHKRCAPKSVTCEWDFETPH